MPRLQDRPTRRAVWLRIFDRPLIESTELEDAFGRALAITDAVQSANIPSGVDCFVEDGSAAIAIDYAASQPVLWAMIIAFTAAAVLAVPALIWLFSLTERGVLGEVGATGRESTDTLLDRLRAGA